MLLRAQPRSIPWREAPLLFRTQQMGWWLWGDGLGFEKKKSQLSSGPGSGKKGQMGLINQGLGGGEEEMHTESHS